MFGIAAAVVVVKPQATQTHTGNGSLTSHSWTTYGVFPSWFEQKSGRRARAEDSLPWHRSIFSYRTKLVKALVHVFKCTCPVRV